MKVAVKYFLTFTEDDIFDLMSDEAILGALDDIPFKSSESGLSELYGKLFKRTTEHGKVSDRFRQYIEQSLDLLAIASRPITVTELAYAVALQVTDRIPDVRQVNKERIVDLIRPFVIITEGPGGAIVRLFHQSLKDLLLQRAPPEWISKTRHTGAASEQARVGASNEKMASLCLKYVQRAGTDDLQLFPEQRFETFKIDSIQQELSGYLHLGSIMDDDDPGDLEEIQSPVIDKFDPCKIGFGGFFSYAACQWPQHLSESSSERSWALKHLLCIAQAGSTRLQNWSEQYRRPVCTHIEERDLPLFKFLDPLVISANFGWESMAIRIFEDYLNDPLCYTRDTISNTAKAAVDNGLLLLTKEMFDKVDRALMFKWEFYCGILLKSGEKDWAEFFKRVVQATLDTAMQWGPDTLCEVAGNGCLPAARLLFQIGDEFPEFRVAMLESRCRAGKYQSVAEAARNGHVEMVRYLCQQEGIENHLHHQGGFEHGTVFHAVADSINCSSSAMAELIPLLFEYYPEGVDLFDDYCTPLHTMVLKKPHIEAVEAFLSTGKVNVNSTTDSGITVLMSATENARVELIPTLVKNGANLDKVLGFGDDGNPYLKSKPAFPEARELVLKTLLDCRNLMERGGLEE